MARPPSLVLAAFATALAVSPAIAGVPAASTSYVSPHLVSCPAGDSTFVVITRHITGTPWAERGVTVDLCGCPGYQLSLAGSHSYSVDTSGCVASMTPDGNGYSLFPLAGGGLCPGDTIAVFAEGILMGRVLKVASFDQDGDLRVGGADIALVQSKLGTADPTADFDGDGLVTEADLAIAEGHLGHVAVGVITGVPPAAGGLALSSPRPNPFSGETRLSLTLDREAPVEMFVCDLAGRRVATAFHGDLGPGVHSLAWQGRRADGSRAPGGVYFVEVLVAGQRLQRKAVFVGGR